MMKKGETSRGFALLTFKDTYDKPCSIQESSLASYPAIWIGYDGDQEKHPVTGELMTCRMHLNKNMAKEIGLKLLEFAETGNFSCK